MVLKDIIEQFENDTKNAHVFFVGNIDIEIDGLNLCNRETNKNSILSYAVSDKYVELIKSMNHIKAVIIRDCDKDEYLSLISNNVCAIIGVKKPEQYFYDLHEYLFNNTDFYTQKNFVKKIGNGCNISPSAVIEHGVLIGNNVTIGHNSVVKQGTVIEDNVTIGCNSTIGSEGFQLISDIDIPPRHVTHVGGCHISENVYIGDNVCICNSLFEGVTFIGKNVKIDNLVHVAHNIYIEKDAVITAHVSLCGSSRIEEGAWIAPNSSILNRVIVGKHSKIGLGSVVTRDVPSYAIVYGNPAKEHK